MKTPLLLTCVALLAGCSAAPVPAPEVPHAGCPSPYPVVDPSRALVVEGFGGLDAQLIVTHRQPTRACTTAVVQAREARLSEMR
jgi:hypothetical protein